MVEIVGKSEKKIKLERKTKNLEKITKDIMKEKRKFLNFVDSSENLIFIHNYNPFKMFMAYAVDCENNTITIDKPKHYNFALHLAKKYEEITKEKWTLKTEY